LSDARRLRDDVQAPEFWPIVRLALILSDRLVRAAIELSRFREFGHPNLVRGLLVWLVLGHGKAGSGLADGLAARKGVGDKIVTMAATRVSLAFAWSLRQPRAAP
jgi:hypothetical protein